LLRVFFWVKRPRRVCAFGGPQCGPRPRVGASPGALLLRAMRARAGAGPPPGAAASGVGRRLAGPPCRRPSLRGSLRVFGAPRRGAALGRCDSRSARARGGPLHCGASAPCLAGAAPSVLGRLIRRLGARRLGLRYRYAPAHVVLQASLSHPAGSPPPPSPRSGSHRGNLTRNRSGRAKTRRDHADMAPPRALRAQDPNARTPTRPRTPSPFTLSCLPYPCGQGQPSQRHYPCFAYGKRHIVCHAEGRSEAPSKNSEIARVKAFPQERNQEAAADRPASRRNVSQASKSPAAPDQSDVLSPVYGRGHRVRAASTPTC